MQRQPLPAWLEVPWCRPSGPRGPSPSPPGRTGRGCTLCPRSAEGDREKRVYLGWTARGLITASWTQRGLRSMHIHILRDLFKKENLSHLPPSFKYSLLMSSAPQLCKIIMYIILLYMASNSPPVSRERYRDLVMHSMLIGFASKTLQCI